MQLREQSMAQRKGQIQAELNRDTRNAVSCHTRVPFHLQLVRIADGFATISELRMTLEMIACVHPIFTFSMNTRLDPVKLQSTWVNTRSSLIDPRISTQYQTSNNNLSRTLDCVPSCSPTVSSPGTLPQVIVLTQYHTASSEVNMSCVAESSTN